MKLYIKLFTFAAMSAALFSCVDERYDLEKIKEPDQIVVGQGLAVPVGDASEVKINDLLSISEDAYFKVSEEGDYYMELSSETMHFPYEIPKVEIQVSHPEEFYEKGENIPLSNTSYQSEEIDFQVNNISIKVDDSENVPSEIIDVDKVSVSSTFSYVFNRIDSEAAVTIDLQPGLTIVFPEWISFDFTEDNIFRREGNNLISKTVISLSTDSPSLQVKVVLTGIDFKKLPEGQGLVSPGHLYLNDKVSMSGKLVFRQEAVDTPRKSMIRFSISSEFTPIVLNEIKATMAPKLNLNFSESISINGLPSVFEGDDVVLDMSDFLLYLNAGNNSPFSAGISAEITAENEGNLLKKVEIGSPEPIEIAANSESRFLVSESGTQEEGYKSIKAEGLTDLLSKIPATLKINVPEVTVPATETTVKPGDVFDFSFSYRALIPFAFGKNLNISYSDYIDNLNVNFDAFSFTKAELDVKVTNTIPLEFGIEAAIVDAEKNPVPGVSVETEGKIAQGSLLSPVTSDIKIIISSEQPVSSLDGLSYTLKAASPSEEFSNISLNREQGLRFHDMKLRLNEGLIIDLNNN